MDFWLWFFRGTWPSISLKPSQRRFNEAIKWRKRWIVLSQPTTRLPYWSDYSSRQVKNFPIGQTHLSSVPKNFPTSEIQKNKSHLKLNGGLKNRAPPGRHRPCETHNRFALYTSGISPMFFQFESTLSCWKTEFPKSVSEERVGKEFSCFLISCRAKISAKFFITPLKSHCVEEEITRSLRGIWISLHN